MGTNRLIVIKICYSNINNINYQFGDDIMRFIDPEENELHTYNVKPPYYITIHNLDSYLDYMSETEFKMFIKYLKTL